MNKFLEIFLAMFLGSGAVLALVSGIYRWIIKGRLKIRKNFDNPHTDPDKSRHRIRIINRSKFKTLRDLTPRITFINLDSEDLGDDRDYLISRKNYVPIEQEIIIWDIGESSINLHPSQEIDVDLLHFEKKSRAIIIPSEKGYKKARARIEKLKEYHFYLEFYAEDYRLKKSFRICPNKDKTDVIIREN